MAEQSFRPFSGDQPGHYPFLSQDEPEYEEDDDSYDFEIEEVENEDEGGGQDQNNNNNSNSIPSFTEGDYKSSEMRRLLTMRQSEARPLVQTSQPVAYKSSDVFPDWILADSNWRHAPRTTEKDNEISDILKIPALKRSTDQDATLIKWLMSVWGLAAAMGFKRCASMFKEFKYSVYQPGEDIIREGERGLTFYIIISGSTLVQKESLGVVGQLGKGKSFGEIALTQGKDLRTATVTAQTRVEVLSLHKDDYDYFVRDLQEMERRENFQILSQCKLFKAWPKGKVEKLCNTCVRKVFEPGDYIFRQGDSPDDLFVVVEGSVNIFKELIIISKNRWPVATHKWKQRVRKVIQPIMLKTLNRTDFFGEMAILKNQSRSTSAIAASRCVLIALDKSEFLFSVQHSSSSLQSNREDDEDGFESAVRKYVDDEDIIDRIGEIHGGPNSTAFVGNVKLTKREKSPNSSRPSTTGTNRRAGSPPFVFPGQRPRSSQPTNNFSEVMVEVRKDGLSEKMRSAAMVLPVDSPQSRPSSSPALPLQQQQGFDFTAVFNAKHEKRALSRSSTTPIISKLPSASSLDNNKPKKMASHSKLIQPSTPNTPSKAAAGLRRKIEISRNPSMSFIASPTARNKRNSLQGIDNESGAYVFDPNKIVLRRNSAIRIGMVYEHIYQKLQHETMQTLENAEKPKLIRRASAILSDALSKSRDDAPPSPIAAMRSSSNDMIDPIEGNPLLSKLARKETARRSLLLQPSRSASYSLHQQEEQTVPAPAASPSSRRPSTWTRERRLLSKAKISYRDAIEG